MAEKTECERPAFSRVGDDQDLAAIGEALCKTGEGTLTVDEPGAGAEVEDRLERHVFFLLLGWKTQERRKIIPRVSSGFFEADV